MSRLDPALAAALAELARTRQLLVASDYDGVLAPIVPHPDRAFPLPPGIAALESLATLPRTTAALVSGRSRASLAALARVSDRVQLVGSHGSELADGHVPLDADQSALHQRVAASLQKLTRDRAGVWLETKPVSLAVHTRPAPPEVGAAVRAAVLAGPGSWPGIHVTTGKEVVELAVVGTHKGTALAALRSRAGATGVLFLGDDVTDENGFAVLRDGDVGVKVGPGGTHARFRVPDPPAAVQVLEQLLAARSAATAPPAP